MCLSLLPPTAHVHRWSEKKRLTSSKAGLKSRYMKYLGQPQSGSQANTTASHNRAGQYLRSRRMPVTPTRTPKQGILRGKFGAASAAWQSLSQANQSAWTAFAHAYPVVDALGQSIVLTGQQYFIGIQTSLLNAGQPMNLNVPTNTSTPPVNTPSIYTGTNGSVLVLVGAPPEGDFVLCGLSKILSNGVNFNKAFSQFCVLTNESNLYDVSLVYIPQYGSPVAGRKIFSRMKIVNSSGMSGPDLIQQIAVTNETNTDTIALTNAESGILVATFTGGTSKVAYQFDADTGAYVSSNDVVAGVATFPTTPVGERVYVRGYAVEPFPSSTIDPNCNGSDASAVVTMT